MRRCTCIKWNNFEKAVKFNLSVPKIMYKWFIICVGLESLTFTILYNKNFPLFSCMTAVFIYFTRNACFQRYLGWYLFFAFFEHTNFFFLFHFVSPRFGSFCWCYWEIEQIIRILSALLNFQWIYYWSCEETKIQINWENSCFFTIVIRSHLYREWEDK